MDFVDIWVKKEFDGSYTAALEYAITAAEADGDKIWIPYIEALLERLEDMKDDSGTAPEKMLGIISLGTIAFGIAFLYYIFMS